MSKDKRHGFLLESDIISAGRTRQEGATEDFKVEKKLRESCASRSTLIWKQAIGCIRQEAAESLDSVTSVMHW